MREKELRAIFYARVSTEEEEQLNAIEKQIVESSSFMHNSLLEKAFLLLYSGKYLLFIIKDLYVYSFDT